MLAETKANVGILSKSIRLRTHGAHLISVFALGAASSLFLSISFVLCVLSYLLFPSLPIAHGALSLVLPGFELLSMRSFLLGLLESFGCGWYVALIFAPLYNYFAIRFGHASAEFPTRA